MPPPDREARESIRRIQLAERPVADDIDVAAIAKSTSGYSGADLRNLVETACDLAIEESLDAGREKPVSRAHLQAALKELKPTTTEWLTTARNYARYANQGGQYDEVLQLLEKHGRQRPARVVESRVVMIAIDGICGVGLIVVLKANRLQFAPQRPVEQAGSDAGVEAVAEPQQYDQARAAAPIDCHLY